MGRCVAEAFRLVPGSRRLIAARWLLVLLSSLPAGLASRAMLAGGPARSPYFTLQPPPLPWTHLVRLFGEIPAAVPAALATASLTVLGGQFLLAGAVAVLRLPATPADPPRVLASIRRAGASHVRGFLGLVVAALLLGAAGAALLRLLGRTLAAHGDASGWGGVAMGVVIPSLMASLMLLWVASLGAWLLWARALLVIDRPSGAVRAARAAAGVLARHPFAALGFPMALSLGCVAGGGAVVGAWLAAEPASSWRGALWAAGMLAVVGAQSFAWHWMVRAVCLMASALDLPRSAASAGAALQQDGPPRDAISS